MKPTYSKDYQRVRKLAEKIRQGRKDRKTINSLSNYNIGTGAAVGALAGSWGGVIGSATGAALGAGEALVANYLNRKTSNAYKYSKVAGEMRKVQNKIAAKEGHWITYNGRRFFIKDIKKTKKK
jgi:hypothetical protein